MIAIRKLVPLLALSAGLLVGERDALAQAPTSVTNFRVLSAGDATQIVIETDLPLPRVSEALTAAMEKLDAHNITCAISRAALLKLI